MVKHSVTGNIWQVNIFIKQLIILASNSLSNKEIIKFSYVSSKAIYEEHAIQPSLLHYCSYICAWIWIWIWIWRETHALNGSYLKPCTIVLDKFFFQSWRIFWNWNNKKLTYAETGKKDARSSYKPKTTEFYMRYAKIPTLTVSEIYACSLCSKICTCQTTVVSHEIMYMFLHLSALIFQFLETPAIARHKRGSGRVSINS